MMPNLKNYESKSAIELIKMADKLEDHTKFIKAYKLYSLAIEKAGDDDTSLIAKIALLHLKFRLHVMELSDLQFVMNDYLKQVEKLPKVSYKLANCVKHKKRI